MYSGWNILRVSHWKQLEVIYWRRFLFGGQDNGWEKSDHFQKQINLPIRIFFFLVPLSFITNFFLSLCLLSWFTIAFPKANFLRECQLINYCFSVIFIPDLWPFGSSAKHSEAFHICLIHISFKQRIDKQDKECILILHCYPFQKRKKTIEAS